MRALIFARMRIWSLHPQHLDAKGLVALWRETLLAKNVLEGKTKGYRNHPQLRRFKACERPLDAVNHYLSAVYDEAVKRNYTFDPSKFTRPESPVKIKVTKGQVDYELSHLLAKLKTRDPKLFREIKKTGKVKVHPLFTAIKGDIEDWEII